MIISNIHIFGSGSKFIKNLVAGFQFESNVNGIFNINNGVLKRANFPVSATYVTGKNGLAVNFLNNTDLNYGEIPNADVFSYTDGIADLKFSISLWAFFDAYSSSGNFLLVKRDGINLHEWQLFRSPSAEIIFTKFDFTSVSFTKLIKAPLNLLSQWVHIVISDDLINPKFYINGVLATTTVTTSASYTNMQNKDVPLTIGALVGTAMNPNSKHKGKLDEIYIWKNRALSAAEVSELYNVGVGKFYPF